MKKIMKLFPVALAVVALASCSNEDIFNGDKALNTSKLQLIATVEEPSTSDVPGTRAAWYGENVNVIWQAGDQFRVYDAALQKYDNFVCKVSGETKTIELADAKAAVDAHAMAIFPGDMVTYAGWDKASDVVTAVMEVESEVDLADPVLSGGNLGCASNLPMWGNVSDETATDLKVALKHLTAYTDITVYQGAATKIRVIAADKADYETTGNQANKYEIDEIAGKYDNQTVGAEKPLTGYFDAQLKEGGALVANWSNAAIADKFGYVITYTLPTTAFDEYHVYIPIIAQKYGKLVIQYNDGSQWKELKAYTNQNIPNNALLKNGLTIGVAPISAHVSSLADLNTKLGTVKTNYDDASAINVILDGAVATTESAQTLTIPAFTYDRTINIKGAIGNAIGNKPLQITGGKAGVTITLNIEGGINGSENIEINTTGKLKLIGNYNSTGTDQYHGTFDIKSTPDVIFGDGQYAPFNSNMLVKLSAAAPLTVNAGEGTVKSITSASTGVITVQSGTVTSLTCTDNGGGAVNINGGTVGTLTTKGTDNAVTVANATVNTIDASNSAAQISINAGANVTSLNTAATIIGIASSVETLTVSGAAANLTVTGGSKTADLVEITNLVGNNSGACTVTSKDAAAIMNVTTNNGKTGFTWSTSSLTTKAADVKTTQINANGEIYTIAQLAGVTTGKNYKLMATTFDAASKDWNAPSISGTFDGNGKNIQNLSKAGLFGTISGGEVKNLTISTVANAADNNPNKGALASQVTGTVSIKNVTVTEATIGGADDNKTTQKSYGGLIGKANGTITLQDNKVTATVQGYANMGGYIGEVAGGSVTIKTSSSTSYQSAITFAQKSASTAASTDFGTIGNFIGTISGSGVSVWIGKADTTPTLNPELSYFFDVDGDATPNTKGLDSDNFNGLKCNQNKKGDAPFKGMQGAVADNLTLGYEIGYSTGSINSLFLYRDAKDLLDNPYVLSINDINQY